MYLRFATLLIGVIATAMASGCATMGPYGSRLNSYPAGCETNCGDCNNCSGEYGFGTHLPRGPLEAMHIWRTNLFHGNGCGEVYRGEWMSTPPAVNDPCCNTGCGDCSPTYGQHYGHHFQPGLILGHLYGKRLCGQCGLSHLGIGCAQPGGCYESDCGCQGEIINQGEYIEPTSTARMAVGMTPKRAATPSPARSVRTAPVKSRSGITRAAGNRGKN